MRLPWRRELVSEQPGRVSARQLELQIAKEILAEVFHVRPADVEEMIQKRLEEDNRLEKEGLWPKTFCLGESSYGP